MSARRRVTRRHRRQARMTIRSKGKFRVGHKSRSGRTGKVAEKQRAGAVHEAKKRATAPPQPAVTLGEDETR